MSETQGVAGTILEEAIQPHLSLTLTPKAAKELEDAKPGLPITLVVSGVVTAISLRDDPEYPGCLELEVNKCRMARDRQNPVAEMFYEDEGPGGGAS